MNKVSVIIPVYNAQEYISKCLDSVINQTLTDIEIICVNDGSKDDSEKIIKEYMIKDNRIKLISQENQGVSQARNNALKIASGEYISFVDADDWLEPFALQHAFCAIGESDVLIFGGNNIVNDKFYSKINIGLIDNYLLKPVHTDFLALNTVIWDKLFKTKFLKENNFNFPTQLKVSEDGIFCLLLYFAGAKYAFLSECLYNHNSEIVNSLTNRPDAIKEDIKSLKYLFELEQFKKQEAKIQLGIINKFCGGAMFYWKKLADESLRESFYNDIVRLKNFIEKYYSLKDLKACRHYRRMVKTLKKYKGEFPYNIYCKMKYKNSKLIRIFGMEKVLLID